jgi:NADP-dependent 3-hydroxy acid dehydrogenase YdfG
MFAIISGASKGIGFAIAKKFVVQGFDLAICSRHPEEIEKAASELQALRKEARIMTYVCDLQHKEQAQAFGEAALNEGKRIDVLVNNAGTFIPGNITDEADGMLEKMMGINLYSAYHITRSVIHSMKKNELVKGTRGHIFNLSSVAALKAYPNGGSYSISKYALEGFSKNLREELKTDLIKVSTIQPGATMSDSWSGSGIDASRIMRAEDIADAIWMMYSLSPQAVVEDIVLRPQLGDV